MPPFAADNALLVPLSAAAIAGLVGITTLIANVSTARRAARRKLYTDAYGSILQRLAFVDRVRTRAPGADAELTVRYWDILEEISYYEGALWAESHRMGDAFQRFSDAICKLTEPALVEAWRRPAVGATQAACHPMPPVESYDIIRATYLLDARKNSAGTIWHRAGMERRFRARLRQDETELRAAWRKWDSHDGGAPSFKVWLKDSDQLLKPLSRREALRNGARAAVWRAIEIEAAPAAEPTEGARPTSQRARE